MFFAPPKVKSLSKYSEFGTHLQHRDFLLMVGIAVVLHLIIMVAYSLQPYEPTMIIPVRVLNIKLNGVEDLDMPPVTAMPQENKPVQEPRQEKPITMQNPEPSTPAPISKRTIQQNKADKTFTGAKHKPLIEILSQDNEKRKSKSENAIATDSNTMKPKKYVRESQLTQSGKYAGSANTQGGKEIASRYTQEISLWVSKHSPAYARELGLEGRAYVRIRIDRSGNILYSAIDRSSGNSRIDQAVMAMVRDSNPVPPVPQNYPEGNQIEFLIPVTFSPK